MDLRIGAVYFWNVGPFPDSNAGGVVAGSVHQLMQSDQVILVSAGCLQLFTTITATAPDRDRGRVFEAEPGLRDRLAALQAY
ncbi:hypothetical protein ABBQ38_006706 [Trebouxia sp. C0009 RCD-2024]